MTFRLAIRTICYQADIHLAVDLAVEQSPECWLPALPGYDQEDGFIVGRFDSGFDARQAHHDAITMVQAIDALGLCIADDQSIIYRDRRLVKMFGEPLVLTDSEGRLAVLDLWEGVPESVYNEPVITTAHKAWMDNHPLKRIHGWNFAEVDVPKLSDGSQLRLSSPEMDIHALFCRVGERRLV